MRAVCFGSVTYELTVRRSCERSFTTGSKWIHSPKGTLVALQKMRFSSLAPTALARLPSYLLVGHAKKQALVSLCVWHNMCFPCFKPPCSDKYCFTRELRESKRFLARSFGAEWRCDCVMHECRNKAKPAPHNAIEIGTRVSEKDSFIRTTKSFFD